MITSSIPVREIRDDGMRDALLLRNMEKRLYEAGARVSAENNIVRFTGSPVFLTAPWHRLFPITSGEIRLNRNNRFVRYRLTFGEFLVLNMILSALVGGVTVLSIIKGWDIHKVAVLWGVLLLWILLPMLVCFY